MNESRQLAEYVFATGFAGLPSEVVAAMKVYILDDLASGFAGARTPWALAVASLAREQAGVGPCAIFGWPRSTTASFATLANGVMVGGFECDHPFTQGSCHPSAAVFPAVLAIGQEWHTPGALFLTATALGYEVLCRVGMAATRAVEDERGFHGPGTNAAFGAAAGAGKALGLNAGMLLNALGIAGSHGGGILEFFRDGAMTKRLHIGRGGQMGLEAAMLASRGFTGPSTVLEGERGFLNVYSPDPHPERLVDGLGERYLLLGMTLKSYPCHVTFQAVVDGLQRLREQHAVEPGRVERLAIAGGHRMLEARFGNRRPGTLLGAQYSLPWSAALALCRDVSAPAAWSESDLANPDLQRIAAAVDLTHDPRFDASGGPTGEVTVVHGGETWSFEVSDWKGAPTNPFSYDEIAGKFARYAAPYLPPSDIQQVVERVDGIEKEPDIADLAAFVQGA